MRIIAKKYNKTLAQFTLAWIAGQPGITSVLIGCRNRKQTEENLGIVDLIISEEDNKIIRDISNSLMLELPDWASIWTQSY